MLWLVVIIPALAAVAVLASPWRAVRRGLLPTGSIAHLAVVAALWFNPIAVSKGGWLAADEPAKLFLTLTSILFLAAALYALCRFPGNTSAAIRDSEEGFLFTNHPEAVFIACLLGFLATMSLVCISQHIGLLWVAVEATTLVSAPLIYFHRHHRSLEAAWKYLLICSVGIAIALLGNFCLAFAAKGNPIPMTVEELKSCARILDPTWLQAAFLMFLVGYGTKMGLAPMHTWLPDAHSEAPSSVSVLMSGALLNCAFLAIMRIHSIMAAAGLAAFSGELLIVFGMLSMATAAVFLIRQRDFKRLLAYSSIEHMGILALGLGLGGLATQGALLHSINHSLAKGLLFLTAGGILANFRTKKAEEVKGMLRTMPLSGFLWLAGFFAIAGSPPFGMFLSELVILRAALGGGHWIVAAGYLLILGVVFVALAKIVLPMVFGLPEGAAAIPEGKENGNTFRYLLGTIGPALALCATETLLGFYVPSALWNFLREAAAVVGVR